jgi:hypothetical protein
MLYSKFCQLTPGRTALNIFPQGGALTYFKTKPNKNLPMIFFRSWIVIISPNACTGHFPLQPSKYGINL